MSSISTHVLDTSRGKPAAGVRIDLAVQRAESLVVAGGGITDADGRVKSLLATGASLEAATYRLTFHVADYFESRGVRAFYPLIPIVFQVADPAEHHHVPLLLNPWGYSTYRGS